MKIALKVLMISMINLFTIFEAQALNFEYGIGGLTPHLKSPPNSNLCNQVSPGSNIIFNKINSFRVEGTSFGTGALVGENSYCEPIWGATGFYNFYNTQNVQMRGTLGFYHFDTEGFDFSEGAYFSRINNFYFVPIAGIEVNFNLYQSKSFQIKMLNLITPVISNHSVGILFDI